MNANLATALEQGEDGFLALYREHTQAGRVYDLARDMLTTSEGVQFILDHFEGPEAANDLTEAFDRLFEVVGKSEEIDADAIMRTCIDLFAECSSGFEQRVYLTWFWGVTPQTSKEMLVRNALWADLGWSNTDPGSMVESQCAAISALDSEGQRYASLEELRFLHERMVALGSDDEAIKMIAGIIARRERDGVI